MDNSDLKITLRNGNKNLKNGLYLRGLGLKMFNRNIVKFQSTYEIDKTF